MNQEEPTDVPPIVHEALSSPGQPLDAATRAFFELRFGHDFSNVRVHTGARAAESARAVNALAYTVGRDVVFGTGQYSPDTRVGWQRLAHELTHVVQQQGAVSGTGRPLRVDLHDSAAEQEAAIYSVAVTETLTPRIATAARAGDVLLQRQPLGNDPGGANEEATLLWESFRHSVTLTNFDYDKAMLKSEHDTALKEFKARFQALLGRYPDSFISVIGYTDATGTEAYNTTLGQERADAVKSALTSGDSALPASIIHAGSLGKSMLSVETKGPEARNRRVEIIPRLRRFFRMPLPQPSPPWSGFSVPSGNQSRADESGVGPSPFIPGGATKIPDFNISPGNWLEDALKKDPIVKSLPDWMQEKVIAALKDGDEMLLGKVIDSLPLEPKIKAALQAVVKSALQLAKGKKFEAPPPPLHEMPPSSAPKFQKLPGEVIIPGPTFKF